MDEVAQPAMIAAPSGDAVERCKRLGATTEKPVQLWNGGARRFDIPVLTGIPDPLATRGATRSGTILGPVRARLSR